MYDGHKVRFARLEAGLSVCELAKMAGLSEKTIYNVERGNPFYPATARKLAIALDKKPVNFISDELLKGA